MRHFFLLLIIISIFGILNAQNISLTKVKVSESVFKTPESILWNSQNGDIYVSNINGSPMEKDGNGFISIIKTDGTVKNLKWITGLNAPKGSDILADTLFVTDIDQLVLINWKTGKILRKITVKNAVFLNDIAAIPDHEVFFSDYDGDHSTIYKYAHGKISEFLKTPVVNRPNGMLFFKGKFYVGNSGTEEIFIVNPGDGKIEKKIKVGRGIDGLKSIPGASFLTSDWSGRVTLTTASGKVFDLLDTREEKINTADFEFIPKKQLLLIPTFYANTVAIYRLVPEPVPASPSKVKIK